MIHLPENPEFFDWKPDVRKPQIHYSALDLLWRCGIAFEFRYVKRLRMLPSAAVHVGRGVDTAVNQNLQTKVDTDLLMPTEQVLDIARDATRHSFDESGVMPGPDDPTEPGALMDQSVDKAVRLTSKHATALAPILKPKMVQRRFEMEIDNFPFDIVGTRDLDEVDGTIRDLKTSKKSPPKDASQLSDQGTLYVLAKWVIENNSNLDTLPMKFVIDTVVDLKRGPSISTLPSTRTVEDFEVMAARIENAARIIESGMFTPARQTDWFCSLTFCSYAPTCPYFRRPVSVATGEIDE